jgi:pantoate--beta-alanine ligase
MLGPVGSIASLREQLEAWRQRGSSNGLVPTMGALHAGHARLIERARTECSCVAVSIFVNPLQFDRDDDLARYPRTIDADLVLCESLGTDIVFMPTTAEMYPSPLRCAVDVGKLADHLCGRYRPGHFRGVATVVLKLLEIVQPDAAYFGEKDGQQLAIIRTLVADFNVPVSIIGVPTVREVDGLALSSRNQHLDACERKLAPALYRALLAASAAIGSGNREAGAVKQVAASQIPHDERLRLEYLEVVDPESMQPVDHIGRPVLVAGALWVGQTRLIDNVRCDPHTA